MLLSVIDVVKLVIHAPNCRIPWERISEKKEKQP
jgi:hypothetical protein